MSRAALRTLLVLAGALAGCGEGAGGSGPDASDGGVGDADATRDVADAIDDADPSTPLDRRGTPAITDPGTGRARLGAGFYRLGVQAPRAGLAFPSGRRTLIDFYYSSDQEVFSTGLGGKLTRVPFSGTAAAYGAPFGDRLHLLLERAQAVPHTFIVANLTERNAGYAVVVNKIAAAPFEGGPTAASAARFVPALFTVARGRRTLRCTEKVVATGSDATFHLDQTYALELGEDGRVHLATENGEIDRTFDEAHDTHVWPSALVTSATLDDGGGERVITLTLAEPTSAAPKLSVVVEYNRPPLFATYTLTEP